MADVASQGGVVRSSSGVEVVGIKVVDYILSNIVSRRIGGKAARETGEITVIGINQIALYLLVAKIVVRVSSRGGTGHHGHGQDVAIEMRMLSQLQLQLLKVLRYHRTLRGDHREAVRRVRLPEV